MSYQSLYFKNSELDCQCGCGSVPTEEMLRTADKIRQGFGHPLNCTSGRRCRKHQINLIAQGISKAKNSRHIDGNAMDFAPVNPGLMPAFREYIRLNCDVLGVWFEDFDATPVWIHAQIVPYPSWTKDKPRKFKP